MPSIVVKNVTSAPFQGTAATTLFTKADGLWVVLEDGTVYGPLGVGLGGPAGGALAGSYPNPTIATGAVGINQIADGSVTGVKIANSAISLAQINPSLIDPIPALPGLRTLGSGANQAVAGNDPKLYNARVPTGTAAGAGSDLGGTYPSPTIAKLQGFPLSIVAPAVNNVLTWDGAKWVAAPGGGGGGVPGGDLSGTIPAAVVVGLQTYPVSATAPLPGEGLVWNGIHWAPTAVTTGMPGQVGGTWSDPTTLLTVRTFVRSSGVANTVVAADKTLPATALPLVGMISAIPVAGTVTVIYYGEVFWAPGTLTPGARYFLNTSGTMVTPAPAPVVGEVSIYLGYAKSPTIFVLTPGAPVFL
jgi:hypothetical protein